MYNSDAVARVKINFMACFVLLRDLHFELLI